MKRNPWKHFRTIVLSVLLASAGCMADSGDDTSPPVDDHGTGTGTGNGSGTGTGNGSGTGTGNGSGTGSGTGTGGTNSCAVRQNDNEIRCTDGACLCFHAGQQVSTCNAPDPESACSSPGNCCGF